MVKPLRISLFASIEELLATKMSLLNLDLVTKNVIVKFIIPNVCL